MPDTFITLDSNGKLKEIAPINTSAGVADAGKVIKLDGDGRVASNMMPTGVGADIDNMPTSEDLTAGDLVDVFDDAGTIKCRKADKAIAGQARIARGFVLSSVLTGASVDVYRSGDNTQMTALTLGADYFLGTTGGVTTTPTTVSGEALQKVGYAVSATILKVKLDPAVTRA